MGRILGGAAQGNAPQNAQGNAKKEEKIGERREKVDRNDQSTVYNKPIPRRGEWVSLGLCLGGEG
jgi:hypothetical protein